MSEKSYYILTLCKVCKVNMCQYQCCYDKKIQVDLMVFAKQIEKYINKKAKERKNKQGIK